MTPKKIQNFLNDLDYEVEARFGFFNENVFSPQISILNYENIKKYFLSQPNIKNVQTKTCTETSNHIRRIIEHKNISNEQKLLIYNDDFLEYGVRISVHKESEIVNNTNTNNLFCRKKDRISFWSTEKCNIWVSWRIDLTIVIETFNGKFKNKKYELELERIDTNVTVTEFCQRINDLLRISQNSYYLLNYSEISCIKNKWNSIIPAALGLHNKHFFNEYISRAKDITLKDMMNPKYVNESMITAKLDGIRRYIFLLDNSIHEIYPPLDISCIGEINIKCEGTILDTEKIDEKYYPFDILIWEGKNLIDTSFANRLAYLTKTMNRYNFKNIEMLDLENGKTYLSLEDTNDEMFSSLAEKCLGIIKKNNIINDGLIIQPLWAKYINQPPINLKWKPSDQLHIDFQVLSSKNTDEYELYYFDVNILTKFVGTKIYCYDKTIYFENGYFNSLPVDGSIVEFCYRNNNFVPIKVRQDKTRPNGKMTIFNLWDLIQNPVTEETLTCKNKKAINYTWQVYFMNYLLKKYDIIGIDYDWKYFSWRLVSEISQKNTYNKIYIISDDESIESEVKEWDNIMFSTSKSFLSFTNKNVTLISDNIIYTCFMKNIVFYSELIPKDRYVDIVDIFKIENLKPLLSLQSQNYIKNKMQYGYQFNKTFLKSTITEYPELGENSVLITQPPTGSCFYHGVLYALYEEYREKDEKIDMVSKFRRKMALSISKNPEHFNSQKYQHLIELFKIEYHKKECIKLNYWTKEKIISVAEKENLKIPDNIITRDDTNFKKELFMFWGCEELEKMTRTKLDWNAVAKNRLIQDLKNVTTYTNECTFFLVEKFLNINILVIDRSTNKLMIREESYDSSRLSIVLIIIKDLHYDLLGFKENDYSLRFWFEDSHHFLKYIRTLK